MLANLICTDYLYNRAPNEKFTFIMLCGKYNFKGIYLLSNLYLENIVYRSNT